MSINHETYTLVIVDEYSRMVENQNAVKVKQIKTDNRTEFKNSELESFYDEKGISQNFSSLYTPEQNGVAKRKNKTLIEPARTMLNGLVLSKHFWTEAVRIAYYTQNRSIIVKRHDKTPYEIFRETIPDISYFYVFGCHVFIHNHKDHLGKFYAKAGDGYSLDTHLFTNISVDEIGIDDSSRYPLDEFLQENDPSRQYQANLDISYYITPHGPPDLVNTERTQEQNVRNELINSQPTEESLGYNTETSVPITEPSVFEVTRSQINHHASTSSYLAPHVRWSRDQHIEPVNIIDEPTKGMLTESMAAKLTTASTSECLFADFLFETEPKKMSEALKRPWWVDAIQE
ncbi:retrovirus-related pol polyprotein from transposon TNT 1-94 [Tanacetum coccineum]